MMQRDQKIQKGYRQGQMIWLYGRQTLAILLALSFTVAVAGVGNNVLAQSRRKPARLSGAQVNRQPSEPKFRTYEFDTVTVDAKGKLISHRKGQARAYDENLNGVGLEMVEIYGGSFTMGSFQKPYGDERPAHPVSVAPFYLGKYEVTQAQWRAVANLPKVNRDLDPAPSNFKGDNLPVEQVKWIDAMEFCARLYRATGRVYRLPSEAEWEYACRAGTTTEFAFGDTITPELVNFDGNKPYGSAPKGMERKRTTPVGALGVANGFGLYDMHGNVEEWCQDIYHDSYEGAPADGSAWEDPSTTHPAVRNDHIARGGYWSWDAEICRSAHRSHYGSTYHADRDLGFRVAASPPIGAGHAQAESLPSPAPTGPQDDGELQHDWHIEEGQNGVNYISNHPAPVPFSYKGEPEATLATEVVKLGRNPRSLSEVVNSEIREIRKGLQIAEYLEADSHRPKNHIASWVDVVEGHKVAFIKYRFLGVKDQPVGIPRTALHAILIKDGKLYFVHLTVLFARHQQEVRGDQIRLVKGFIKK